MEFIGFEIGEETKEVIEDGKKKLVLSPVGMVIFYLNAWRAHGSRKAYDGLRRYCEYICLHGYRGGASKALAEMESLKAHDAAVWIGRTHSRHVKDDSAMLGYVLVR